MAWFGLLLMAAVGVFGVVQGLMFAGLELARGELFFLWALTVLVYYGGLSIAVTGRGDSTDLIALLSGLVMFALLVVTGYQLLSAAEGMTGWEYATLVSYVFLLLLLLGSVAISESRR